MSSNLQFQDFGLGGDDSNSPFTSNTVNSNYDRRNTEKDSANLVDGSETESATNPNKHSFLSFKFYQQYFDVDTEQVQARILASAFPRKGCNFIRDQLTPSPDLYGPFWIAVTLVFVAAIFGNFSHYIESLGETQFTNDFRLVTGISTVITCYILLVPLGLYIFFFYRNTGIQYSLVELVSLYGYSIAILIPVSILWILNNQLFRWLLIVVAVLMSGFVLGSTIWDAVKSDKNRLVAFGVIIGVLFIHAGLTVGIKEFYFDSVMPSNQGRPTSLPIKTTFPPLVVENQPADNKPKAEALKAELPKTADNKPKAEALKAELPEPAKAAKEKSNAQESQKAKEPAKAAKEKTNVKNGTQHGNQTKS